MSRSADRRAERRAARERPHEKRQRADEPVEEPAQEPERAPAREPSREVEAPAIRPRRSFSMHDLKFPRDPADVDGTLGTQRGGTWRLRYEKGRACATLACPICGASVDISFGSISATGAIDSAVYCVGERCRWFEYVAMDGWSAAVGPG